MVSGKTNGPRVLPSTQKKEDIRNLKHAPEILRVCKLRGEKDGIRSGLGSMLKSDSKAGRNARL